MKNINGLIVLITLVGVSVTSAYYDQYGTWHEDIVTGIVETVAPSLTDKPQDTQARKEASRKLKHEEKKARQTKEDKERKARRKYDERKEKIQEEKEKRRLKNS